MLTVSGTNMDVVAAPVMTVTVYLTETFPDGRSNTTNVTYASVRHRDYHITQNLYSHGPVRKKNCKI